MTQEITPEGWPDSAGQFDAHSVSDDDLARWEKEARLEAWRIPLGRFNWPGAMRSLIEEVRRVRRERAEIKQAEERAYDRSYEAGVYAGMSENG